MKETIAIKVTTKDPKRNYVVHFTRDTRTLIDVLECRTMYEPGFGRMTSRTSEIVEAARSGIGKTFETATAGEAP